MESVAVSFYGSKKLKQIFQNSAYQNGLFAAQIADPWKKLRDAFNGNRDCMVVSEAYDFGEAIRKLIMKHWSQIGSLEKYKKDDDKFFKFVISGLKDETDSVLN